MQCTVVYIKRVELYYNRYTLAGIVLLLLVVVVELLLMHKQAHLLTDSQLGNALHMDQRHNETAVILAKCSSPLGQISFSSQ